MTIYGLYSSPKSCGNKFISPIIKGVLFAIYRNFADRTYIWLEHGNMDFCIITIKKTRTRAWAFWCIRTPYSCLAMRPFTYIWSGP